MRKIKTIDVITKDGKVEFGEGYEFVGTAEEADAILMRSTDLHGYELPEGIRAIARCGNTGISALIDNKGRIVEQSPWWQPATLHFQLPLNDELTFFVSHGDITGRLCTFTFLLLLAAAFVKGIVNHGYNRAHQRRA